MRLSLRFLLMLFPALAALILGFFVVMDRIEHKAVVNEFHQRAVLIRESLHDGLVAQASVGGKAGASGLQKILDRVGTESRHTGLLVCSADWETQLAKSGAVPPAAACDRIHRGDPDTTGYVPVNGTPYHRAIYPIADESGHVRGNLVILQNPYDYMARRGVFTRKYAIAGFLVLVLLIALVTVLVHQWSVSQRIEQLSRGMKGLLRGDLATFSKMVKNRHFRPLVDDLDRVLVELRRAKGELIPAPSPRWTPERLRSLVQRLFGNSRLCIIANREPYIHNRKGKQITTTFPASGLVTAVEPIVRACSGLWIGHGSGTADRETADNQSVILVPPGKPEYALKRVWLTPEEEKGYYYGFANEGLWPLCHIAHTRPIFRSNDFHAYQSANAKFADAFCEQMKSPEPIALIQDYHFALLPGMIHRRRPDAVVSLFWHIPWPNPEVIQICPWKSELLNGMLGCDLIGFHTQYHCNNFLDTVDRFLEARVDREAFSVTMHGHTTFVRPFPISVEWPPKHDAPAEEVPKIRAQLLEELNIPQDSWVGLGVDRLDYTKGIGERLRAIECLLENYPELVGRFVFIQISAPSRTPIKRYQELEAEVREIAERVNFKFRRDDYEPIRLRLAHHDSAEVFRYYRAADVCLVTSLHDGMNLVAKEYVAARSDCGGALVLSTFTGAARDMNDAVVVNPYDIEETAKAIYKCLTMDPTERTQRMERLREQVATHNAYAWAGHFLEEVHRVAELRRHHEPMTRAGT